MAALKDRAAGLLGGVGGGGGLGGTIENLPGYGSNKGIGGILGNLKDLKAGRSHQERSRQDNGR